MLRRKPTALTISPEDLTTFEQEHAQHKEQREYIRSQRLQMSQPQSQSQSQFPDRQISDAQAQYILLQQQNEKRRKLAMQKADEAVDPNDELKPLPGDKARIVRSREDRVGVGSSSTLNGNTTADAAGVGDHAPARM